MYEFVFLGLAVARKSTELVYHPPGNPFPNPHVAVNDP